MENPATQERGSISLRPYHAMPRPCQPASFAASQHWQLPVRCLTQCPPLPWQHGDAAFAELLASYLGSTSTPAVFKIERGNLTLSLTCALAAIRPSIYPVHGFYSTSSKDACYYCCCYCRSAALTLSITRGEKVKNREGVGRVSQELPGTTAKANEQTKLEFVCVLARSRARTTC